MTVEASKTYKESIQIILPHFLSPNRKLKPNQLRPQRVSVARERVDQGPVIASNESQAADDDILLLTNTERMSSRSFSSKKTQFGRRNSLK